MKTTHLSPWEQEECVIERPTPQMLRHLNECAECRGAVLSLQNSAAIFRSAALVWSAETLAARPRPLLSPEGARRPVPALRWVFAAVLPLVLLVLVFLGLHPSRRLLRPVVAVHTPNTDDALLEQVDEQLSVAVPASMESLTHLVSTDGSSGAGGNVETRGGKPVVQTN